jgi:hypothetical protein
MCRKLTCLIYLILVLILTSVPATADPFQQDRGPDGIVSIEAENFDESIPIGEWFLAGRRLQRRLRNAVNAHSAGGRRRIQ